MEERDDPRELETPPEDASETAPTDGEEVLEHPSAPPPRRASGGRTPPPPTDDSGAGLRERQLAWNRERVRIEAGQVRARAPSQEPVPPGVVRDKPKGAPDSSP